MKYSIRKILALILLTIIAIGGCGKKESENPDFTIGAWNGNVFENSWLNMKFEIDDQWTVASDEKIAEISGIGAEILSELKGTSKENFEAMAKITTVYGFMVLKGEGDPSIQLVFENLAKTTAGTQTTEEEYLDMVLDQLTGLGYEIIEETRDEKIADKTFKKLKLSAYEGLLTQDFYCYKQDDYIVSIITTYTDATESDTEEFIDNISVLK
ncbi:MAG: hypothetical protein GX321_08360 [Clostridiales bacterium]|nr:hypothetical protein [Clostridiales bacterium]